MDVIEVDPELVRRYVAEQIRHPHGFHAEISLEDEMLLHALAGYRGKVSRAFTQYMLQGKQMMDQVRQFADWAFGGWNETRAFLDFASGHGRFTRHLIQELPAERVVISDLYEDAVRFQKKHFGVHGVLSAVNPGDLEIDRGDFDLIFVSSLFSHLPYRTFQPWLEKLVSLLSARGVLVFTTRKTGSADSDFEFNPLSESRSLEPSVYGTTFVSESFVRKCFIEVSKGKLAWRRIENGHLNFQDVYLLTKNPRADFRALDYQRGFSGHVGACWINPDGTIGMRGWAADFDSVARPIRIEVYANGNLVRELTPDHDRPDIAKLHAAPIARWSGWTCHFDADELHRDDWISIQIVNDRDQRHVISLAPLHEMVDW